VSAPAHPPPPWRLRGDAAILLAPVRLDATRAAPLPPRLSLVGAAGWTVGGVLLARYDETATLPYHELILFSGLARPAGTARLAVIVSHIYVDSEASVAGGRAIWGLPKELAEFDWSERRIDVRQGGRTLLRAAVRRRAGVRAPVPLWAPTLGTLAGAPARAVGRGVLRGGGPALARLDVPPGSPFAALGLAGRARVGVAGGGLDLHLPAPLVDQATPIRPGTSPRRRASGTSGSSSTLCTQTGGSSSTVESR